MRPALLTLAAVVLLGCGAPNAPEVEPQGVEGPTHTNAARLSQQSVTTEDGVTTYSFVASGDDIRYVVRIVESPFVKDDHDFEIKEGKTYVDGKYAWGTLGDEPVTQVTGLSVEMGGKAVDIPAELYSDLFDFQMEQRYAKREVPSEWVVVRLLEDGALMVQSVGSYERGYYLVTWWVGGSSPPVRSIVTDKDEQRRWHSEWATFAPDRPAESTAGEQPFRPQSD